MHAYRAQHNRPRSPGRVSDRHCRRRARRAGDADRPGIDWRLLLLGPRAAAAGCPCGRLLRRLHRRLRPRGRPALGRGPRPGGRRARADAADARGHPRAPGGLRLQPPRGGRVDRPVRRQPGDLRHDPLPAPPGSRRPGTAAAGRPARRTRASCRCASGPCRPLLGRPVDRSVDRPLLTPADGCRVPGSLGAVPGAARGLACPSRRLERGTHPADRVCRIRDRRRRRRPAERR